MLLWHPSVHKLYNEELYYFALRFAPYKPELRKELQERLSQAGIKGICLYEVFGEYDVLLRVWLVQSQLAEVYEIFHKLSSLVAYPLFRVKEVNHWAFERDISDDVLKRFAAKPDAVRAIQQAIRSEVKGDISGYVQEEGAYCVSVSERRFTKFYTALSFREPGRLTIQDESEIKANLRRIYKEQKSPTKPTVKNISIYWGEGLANVLIKGISRNVVGVSSFIIDEVIPKFSGFFPTPTTFIICEGAPYESDEISERALNESVTGTLPIWVETWFPDFYKLGANRAIVSDVEAWLSSNYQSVQLLSGDFKSEILKPLLHGIITGDSRRAVRALLPWFAEAEFSLKENWFKFLGAVSHLEGDELKDAEYEIRKNLGLLRESKKEITLGDRLNMHLEALKKYQPNSGLLAGKSQTAELTEIRNDFAHGNILIHLSAEWRKVLDLLLWFLPRYEGVLKLAWQTEVEKAGV